MSRKGQRDAMDSHNPTTPPPPGKMRMSPEHQAWFQGAALAPQEAARRACESAWQKIDGKLTGLLEPPAGLDEARMKFPHLFGAAPAAGPPAAPHGTTIPPPEPSPPVDDERERDDHVAYWSALINGSRWPADVAAHAVAAIEARGPRTAADAMLRLAACDGWQTLPAHYRAVLRTVLVDGASKVTGRDGKRHCWVYPGTANATIGSTRLDGTGWRQPDPAALENDPDAAPWAPVSDVDASAEVWPAVASGLAYTGRLTLLSGIAKAGKSTLAGGAAAGVASGADWLTAAPAPAGAGAGSVIWIGAPGESQADEVRRLAVQAGAAPAALGRILFMPMRPSAGIVAALAKHAPADLRLVVIDSARGLLTADGGEEDRSDDVRRTLGALAKWQADHAPGAAVVAIHHMRRDREARTGDRTRGSGDWLAAVDLIVEFDRTDTGAELTYSGRTGAPAAPLFLAWRGGRYTPGRPPDAPVETGGADMDGDVLVTDRATYDRVLGHLMRQPNTWQSTGAITRGTGARKAKVITALEQLATAGRIDRRAGKRNSTEYRPVPVGADPGGAERRERVGADRPVPANGERVGNGSGTGHGNGSATRSQPYSGTGHGNGSRERVAPVPEGTETGTGRGVDQGPEGGSEGADNPEPPLPAAGPVETVTAPVESGAAPPADGADDPEIAALEAEHADKRARVAELEAEIADLAELTAEDLTAARQRIRTMAVGNRCRFCGAPPPLEPTGPGGALMLCGRCAATYHAMMADGRSIGELRTDLRSAALKRLRQLEADDGEVGAEARRLLDTIH